MTKHELAAAFLLGVALWIFFAGIAMAAFGWRLV